MKIIISPAKKMNTDTDTFQICDLPEFMADTKTLMSKIRSLSLEDAKALWKCNDKLAELNYKRFQDMDLERVLTPAIMAYEGLQYRAEGIYRGCSFLCEGASSYFIRLLWPFKAL